MTPSAGAGKQGGRLKKSANGTMKPILFSVSYAGYWGQAALDVPDFIRKAAALGYGGVQLAGKRPHLSPADIKDDELRRIRDVAGEAAVEIATVAAYNDFAAGGASPMIPHVEIQLAYLRSLLRCAQALNAKVLRIFTGFATGDTQHLKDWNACVKAVREASSMAADHGVALGVQNHHDIAVGLASYAEFLDEVDHPNCRAMFDPWSVAVQGEPDLRAAAKALAPRMIQTTLADYVRLRRFAYVPGVEDYREQSSWLRAVPLGAGDVMDLGAFMQGLKEGGFKGYVCYEMCSPLRGGGSLANLDRTARESLATLKRLTGRGRKSS